MKSKGRAERRRGRQYRKSRTKRRNKILDLDPENIEGNKRAKELEKEMELKKKLDEPPKKNQSDFIPKSVREIMRFQEQLKKKDSQQNDASNGNNNSNNKRKDRKSFNKDTGKGSTQSSKTNKQLQSNRKSKENAHENNTVNDIIKTEVPKIIAEIKKQPMTNRKLKNKLWSKMKKEKQKLKKIRKELNQINALERSKLKKRKREDSKPLVLDEDEDILDEDDLLNINLEDDEFEDVSRGVLQQDHVEFGEQVKEPPKKLKKLRDQIDAKYEARRKFKEMQQTMTPKELQQEMNRARQMEITREKVLKNYEEAKKRRMEKRTSTTDSQIQQLQNFSAKFSAGRNEQDLLEF